MEMHVHCLWCILAEFYCWLPLLPWCCWFGLGFMAADGPSLRVSGIDIRPILHFEIMPPVPLQLLRTWQLLWLSHLSIWHHCWEGIDCCSTGENVRLLGFMHSFCCNIPCCCGCIDSFCWPNMLWLLPLVLRNNQTTVLLVQPFSALALLAWWQGSWVLEGW